MWQRQEVQKMSLSELIGKIKWGDEQEWFEKWYSTEQCFLAFRFNPLTKSFFTQGLNSLALNTRWFYETSGSKKWEVDQKKAANSSVTFFQKFISESEKYLRRVEDSYQQIRRLTEIDLKSFNLIEDTLITSWYIFLADIGKDLSAAVDKILTSRNLTKQQEEEIKSYYLSPHKILAYQEEEADLRKIKRANQKQIPRLLQTHQQKYGWLTTSDLDTEPVPLESYLKRMDELDLSGNRSWTKPKLSIASKHALAKKDLLLLNLINKHLYIDNYVADLYGKIDFLFQKLILEKYGLSFKDSSWYTFSELESLVRNGTKLSAADLAVRKKYRVMIQINDKISFFYGKKDYDFVAKLLNLGESESVDMFKGNPASLGRVQGIVKIVRGVKDIDKVQKGDILVANTTHPDLMLAIRRCVAIVTDHGGATSHAAIISRELKIPCIVGTEKATKFLHDGDTIDVDADNGIVKILEHSQK